MKEQKNSLQLEAIGGKQSAVTEPPVYRRQDTREFLISSHPYCMSPPHTSQDTYKSNQTCEAFNQQQKKEAIAYREANANDAQSIAAIGTEVFTITFGHSLSRHDLETYLKEAYSVSAISNDLNDPLKHVIVACNKSGQVVGFAQLTQGSSEPCVANAERPIELQRLYVHQDSHGLGVGKSLIQKAEDFARALNFMTMWLGVWEENFKAQMVYEKAGYVKVGHHDFKMGDCIQTDLIMSKKL
jgi:ribosomal protein S18 acetylase RimI-like enzyme